MTLAKVRKIIGSKGKRTWYYSYTSSDTKCDDGYWIDGYDEPVYTWVDTSHYEWQEVWVDGHYDDNGTWVEGSGSRKKSGSRMATRMSPTSGSPPSGSTASAGTRT